MHAVVVVEPGTDADAVVREANARARRPPADPRRLDLARPRAAAHRGHAASSSGARSSSGSKREPSPAARPPAAAGPSLEALLARYAGGREMRPDTTIEELGLSSLERVELMVALEERLQTRASTRARFAEARTVGDILALLAPAAHAPASASATEPRPRTRRTPRLDDADLEPGLVVALGRRVSQAVLAAAAHAAVRAGPRGGAGAPGRPRRPGGLRGQSPEPPGHAGDPRRAARPAARRASPSRWRRSSSTRTSTPAGHTAPRALRQRQPLLPGGGLLQRVPAAAARGGRAPDAALHRRSAQRRLVGADLPGGRADRNGTTSARSGRGSA